MEATAAAMAMQKSPGAPRALNEGTQVRVPASRSVVSGAALPRCSQPAACLSKATQTSKWTGNWKPEKLAKLREANPFASFRRGLKMPHGARADSQSLQDEQVKTGQPGTQKQSVPSKIVDRKESSTPKEHMKAWKEEITSMIDKRCVDNMRMLTVDAVNTAKAGHPGLPLGMAEVGYVLWRYVMKFNPKNPNWFNRDRFVLSAGHGCLLQYITLHLSGYDSVQIEDLKRLCQIGSRTPGHPENVTTDGIEVTTGPLGQGVANAVGLALAEKHLAARFNKHDGKIVDHRTFCIMGDGCAMEGITNEAASLAAHWKLNKLTVIYDDNHNTIDGDTSLAFSEDVGARFEALGWNRVVIDNIYHDIDSFKEAVLNFAGKSDKPTFIQVKSRIGRESVKENTAKAHHGTFDEDDVKHMHKNLKWENREPFYVIPQVYEEFTDHAKHGISEEEEWNEALEDYSKKYPEEARNFKELISGELPKDWEKAIPHFPEDEKIDATRGYSETCLNAVAKVLPGLIGGSADLASSNKVYMKDFPDFSAETPEGRNIRYGIREHAMAGISNGLALHNSGLIPIAATFLIFSDYMKNSMRLSALSEAGVIYILTHDSIGLGEDGPTHQPVEQLAGLRAIPGMYVLRPADAKEVAGAYKVAISRRHAPTVLSLSRQKVAANVGGTSAEGVLKGGYVVSDNTDENSLPELILIGTGTELALCEKSAETLRQEGKKVRVVSLVCWQLFDQQPEEYREKILPSAMEKRISVEAGSPFGWREYVGSKGKILAVYTFGCSGAYTKVFEKYGFTAENITDVAQKLLTETETRNQN
nr:transketolase, chloroplastic-like isoform X2 [Physcomitrium patens]|eukprot:XP_024385105.1 transketolase, chloroplastic-like isoform X2 [Physcomitrella patens]